MTSLSKAKATKLLQQSIDDFDVILSKDKSRENFSGWVRSVRLRIVGIFGQDSSQAKEIEPHFEFVLRASYPEIAAKPAIALIKSFLSEVNEFWSDETYQEVISDNPQKNTISSVSTVASNRVFIVHGHDHGKMQTVARFIEHLGLEPIILHEKPNAGNTIIEKFEISSDVAYAIVLLTPDDVGSEATNPKNLKPRARQNVILELGYFIARLGRQRTAALVVQGVEIPSDYSGIVYIPIGNSDEWKLSIARELKNAGLDVDINRIL